MVNIDFSKGFMLGRLVSRPKSVSYFDKEKNSSYGNVEMFPYSLEYIKRIYPPVGLWDSLDEFKIWLSDTFRSEDDGIYYLIGWRGSTKRIKKLKRRVRPFEPFVKFQISNGSVSIPKGFKRSKRTGKTYRVWLMFSDKPKKLVLDRIKKIKL